jgi:hypothetical protein
MVRTIKLRALMCGRIVRSIIYAALIVIIGVNGGSAFARQSVEIDWFVPQSQLNDASIVRTDSRSLSLSFQAYPRTLYVASSDVLAADGTKLLPAGQQLYGMRGANLMICSQQRVVNRDYAGSRGRICLRDDDWDGVFDTYFSRTFGRSILVTDGLWFAMNTADLPDRRDRVAPASIREENFFGASATITIEATFRRGRTYMSSELTILNRTFQGSCEQQTQTARAVGEETRWECLAPGLIVAHLAADAADQTENLRIMFPNRDLSARFRVENNLFIGSGISSLFLE